MAACIAGCRPAGKSGRPGSGKNGRLRHTGRPARTKEPGATAMLKVVLTVMTAKFFGGEVMACVEIRRALSGYPQKTAHDGSVVPLLTDKHRRHLSDTTYKAALPVRAIAQRESRHAVPSRSPLILG